jgi:hypothetical protein
MGNIKMRNGLLTRLKLPGQQTVLTFDANFFKSSF